MLEKFLTSSDHSIVKTTYISIVWQVLQIDFVNWLFRGWNNVIDDSQLWSDEGTNNLNVNYRNLFWSGSKSCQIHMSWKIFFFIFFFCLDGFYWPLWFGIIILMVLQSHELNIFKFFEHVQTTTYYIRDF